MESFFLDLSFESDVYLFAVNKKKLCKRTIYLQGCGMTFDLDVWLVVAEKLKINKVREMQG